VDGARTKSAAPRRPKAASPAVSFHERIEANAEQLEDLDTARLVIRIQAGEREPFTALYQRYFDRVYGYLRVALKDSHEAEDLAQQVFTRVFEKIGAYERRAQPFRAWLFVVVRNLTIRHLERQGRMEPTDPVELMRDDRVNGESLTASLPGWLSDQDLTILVERLPLPQRQVLMLRYMLDLSSAEIATVLDRKPSDVRMLQHRALKYLETRLGAIQNRGARGARAAGRRDRTLRRRVRLAPVMRSRRYALR
jgi:RNA polymerase sigma-70 factor (ECF subfamily)